MSTAPRPQPVSADSSKLDPKHSQVDTLGCQIQEALNNANKRRKKHKWFSVLIRLVTSVCTVGVPVLLGWNPNGGDLVRNVAICMGGLATILLGYEAFYGHKELWVINTLAATKLSNLKSYFDYLKSGDPNKIAEKLDELQVRLTEILSEADFAWVGVRQVTAKRMEDQSVHTKNSIGEVSHLP